MEPTVTVVVLVTALIHAAWNAVVKGEEDALVTQATVVVGGAFFAVPFSFFCSFSEPGSVVLLGVERRNPLCLFRGAGGGLLGRRPQFRLYYCARNRTDSRCPAFRISDRRNSFGAPTRGRFGHLLWLVHTRPERPGRRRYSGVRICDPRLGDDRRLQLDRRNRRPRRTKSLVLHPVAYLRAGIPPFSPLSSGAAGTI